jgi:uncharacterized protein involved in outer membrane biogenesis
MGTLLRIVLKTIAGVLMLLVTTVLVLTFIGVTVDLSFLRGGVEASASKALDRKVVIAGPVELEFSNWPALEVNDVSIANVDGAPQDKFLVAGLARLQIGIFPLLRGDIDIADITAEDVSLNLYSDAQGNPNWVFGGQAKATEKAPEPTRAGDDDVDATPAGKGDDKLITFAGLDNLSLKNISVNYHDAALGKDLAFELDTMVGKAPEGAPMMLDFKGQVQDKTYDLALQGGPVSELLARQQPWDFSLKGEVVDRQIVARGDMQLRGHTPDINLEFGIRDFDVGAILAALGLVEGMQASLGDVGFRVSINGDSLQEVLQQSTMAFAVRGGSWKVHVPNTEAYIDINDLHGDILVEKGNAVTMKLDGVIDRTPVKLLISGAPLVEYVTNQDEIPLTIDAAFAKSQFSFASTVKLPISERDVSLSLKVSSERIDHLNELLHLELPPIGPVTFESRLDITKQLFDLSTLDVQVGDSKLDGSLRLDMTPAKPKLDIAMVSKLIQIDDFDTGKTDETGEPPVDGEDDAASAESEKPEEAEASAEEPVGERRQLLSYEVLNAFDADVKIEAQEVMSGADRLGSGLMNINLKDARLAVEPLNVSLPGGSIKVNMDYTPSPTDVTFNVNADIDEFDVGVLVRRRKPESDMGGRFFLKAGIHSRAADLASVMENAEGTFDFALVPKNFSAGIVDLWAVNLLAAIMDKSTEKDDSEINCVIVRTGMKDGLMEEKAIYLDTSNMYVVGKSMVNFKTRELEIKMAPKAKRPEFFSVAIPIQVKGSFDDFGLKIGVVRMTGQVISFITSPIHVPIRRVFTDAKPEDGIDACKAAWFKAREDGAGNNTEQVDKPAG